MKGYRSQIIAALQEHGRMTAIEIAELLDIAPLLIHRAIASGRFQKPGELFRIVGFRPTGKWRADDAIFAFGPGREVKRKPRTTETRAERKKAARARYRAKVQAERNAQNRLYKAAKANREVLVNPWAQLAPPELKGLMGRTVAQQGDTNES